MSTQTQGIRTLCDQIEVTETAMEQALKNQELTITEQAATINEQAARIKELEGQQGGGGDPTPEINFFIHPSGQGKQDGTSAENAAPLTGIPALLEANPGA